MFPSAQRRKMRPFEGFKRKAVIVVNGEEEQARRQALQEATEGKEVPDSTLLEMKGIFVLNRYTQFNFYILVYNKKNSLYIHRGDFFFNFKHFQLI